MYSGDIDDHVETVEFGRRGTNRSRNLGLIGNIGLMQADPFGFRQPGMVDVDGEDRGAFGREPECGGSADPRATTGEQDFRVLESVHLSQAATGAAPGAAAIPLTGLDQASYVTLTSSVRGLA
ncbi:hypothetical protein GCM10009565_75140 [Amycolatopsis albidoflavus]